MIPLETKRRMCFTKRRYKSEGAANRAKTRSARAFGHSMRAYPCPVCHGWHLASSEGDYENVTTTTKESR